MNYRVVDGFFHPMSLESTAAGYGMRLKGRGRRSLMLTLFSIIVPILARVEGALRRKSRAVWRDLSSEKIVHDVFRCRDFLPVCISDGHSIRSYREFRSNRSN